MIWRRSKLPRPLPDDLDCHEVGAVLQAYVDGELDVHDTEVVSAHLAHCRRCGIEASTVEQVIDAIRRQRPDTDPEALRRLAGFVDELSTEGPPPAP